LTLASASLTALVRSASRLWSASVILALAWAKLASILGLATWSNDASALAGRFQVLSFAMPSTGGSAGNAPVACSLGTGSFSSSLTGWTAAAPGPVTILV